MENSGSVVISAPPSSQEPNTTESSVKPNYLNTPSIKGNFSIVEQDVAMLAIPRVQRLNEIRQQEAYMVKMLNPKHTRLEHSLFVKDISFEICKNLGLDEYSTKAICAASLLHDIGHGPFAHISEEALKRHNPHMKSLFDHDAYGQIVISTDKDIEKCFEELGIQKQDVLAILEDDRDHTNTLHQQWHFAYYIVKEVADRCGYLVHDNVNSRFKSKSILDTWANSENLINSLRLVRDPENSNYQVGFTSIEVFEQVMHDRMRLYKNCSAHPYASLARKLLIEAISHEFANKNLEPEDLQNMTDDTLLDRLSKSDMSETALIIRDGVDMHYDILSAFTLDKIKDGESNYFQKEDSSFETEFERNLKVFCNVNNIPENLMKTTVTYDYSKKGENGIKVPILNNENDSIVYQNIDSIVTRQERFVTVFANRQIPIAKLQDLKFFINQGILFNKLKSLDSLSATTEAVRRPVIDNDLFN